MISFRGLENTLSISRFRIAGHGETGEILGDFLTDPLVCETLEINGAISRDLLNFRELSTTVRSMDFFDRLWDSGMITFSGSDRT